MNELLALDVELPLDRFTLRLSWSTAEGALGLFGPSGSGKTSLLEAIAGLRTEARGVIRVAGRVWLDSARGLRLPPERRGVGYVPQDARLFPHRTVLGNLMSGRRRAERSPGRRIDPSRVLDVLELAGREEDDVAALSGGERQRVALGRALLSAPDLLLLDEPLAGLDLPLRRRILPYLLRIREEFDVPTLHVSHDATEVRLLSREAIVMVDGREVARGRPDELFQGPELLARLGAEEYENVLRGRVVALAGSTAEFEVEGGGRITVPAAGLRPEGGAAVLVRAEELIVAVEPPHGLSAQNVLPGTVREVRAPAASADRDGAVPVVVEVGGAQGPLVAVVTPQACLRLGLAPGLSVYLVWKTHACRVVPGR